MRRFLFAVNALIAIALIAGLAAFYWYFYRALPKTSGTIETRVTQPVEVGRDKLGVPHIQARTMDDLWFVEGYTTAEDRMFQMDGLRRLASGELSEIVGPGALESDRESRRMRMRRVAEQIYAQLPLTDKAPMEAYARGVNAYIESHRGRYGIEFTLLGYDPRPWSVIDSLLCGLHMFRTLTSDWKTKLVKQQMLRAGEPDKVNYLYPWRSGLEFSPGGDEHPGSNGWAVSGAHSATGKPLLSNDMHLEFGLPGVWHMEYLEAPGMKVTGVSLPGLPGILSGHNDRIAWGETNLGFDVQDLYLEKMDLRTGQYLFNGRIEQARSERELIQIRGKPTEELLTWVTRHGPVFQIGEGAIMTLKWSASEPGVFANVFIDIDRARNWSEFTHAISRFGGPGQNFVYADVDGHIGYHASGRLPIRRGYAGDVPVDGSTGAAEWQGFIPFEELPQSYDPPDGFVVSANQNPFPPGYPYPVTGSFDPGFRARQIRGMLRAGGNRLTPEDSLRIQKDVYSEFGKFIAQQMVAAYADRKGRNKMFDDAMALLSNWDGQMDKDRPEPLIETLAYQYVRKAVAERASPGNGTSYDGKLATAVVERLLRERPAGWFGNYNQMLLQSLADGMEEGQRMQGANPKRWKWGRYMFLAIENPVVSRVPLLGKYFNIGPVPMSGGPTTVKQTTAKLGPSERMDLSLGDWDGSLLDLPVGESGHIASAHYRDQWDAYYNGKSFRTGFEKPEVVSTVTFVPGRFVPGR
ncbi:MAG: penicillin acylase family protein [Acidobacteriota bacterium]|nr:penicillin acylase family protein [Acidobacteriota bacterium]